jgi:hypothetical protein
MNDADVEHRRNQSGGDIPQANCTATSEQRFSQWLRLDQEVNERL